MSAGSKRGHATVRSAFPCPDCERSFESAFAVAVHRSRTHGIYSQTPDAVRRRQDYDAMRVKVPGKGWEERGPGSTGGGGVVTVRSPFAGAVDIAAAPGEGHGSSPVSVRQGAPGDDRIPCADCTYRFVSEDALRRHRAFKHPEPAESHRAPIVGEVPDDPEPAMSAEYQGLDIGLGQPAEEPEVLVQPWHVPCGSCLHAEVCAIRPIAMHAAAVMLPLAHPALTFVSRIDCRHYIGVMGTGSDR